MKKDDQRIVRSISAKKKSSAVFEFSKLDRIKKMGKINGDPENLVHMNWLLQKKR